MTLPLDMVAPEATILPLEPHAQPLPVKGELAVKELIPETPQILAELVIEEVSIDGMCGVY
jgi:mycofactocin precursor